EPRLEQAEQIQARDPGHLGRLVDVEPELAFEQEIDSPRALLRPQLDAVVRNFSSTHLGMHPGRHRAPVERALGETLLAFEKQLDAFAAAMTADRALVASH